MKAPRLKFQKFVEEQRACNAENPVKRRVRSSHTIYQYFDHEILEKGTTSICELVQEAWCIHPFKPLAYQNFLLRDWNIETGHYDSTSGEYAALLTRLFWGLYGHNIKILTLSHCQIPFNFALLPRVLWKVVPNLESLTLSNCVMKINTKSDGLLGMLQRLRRDSWNLATYPVKLRVLFLRNVTCILDARFPIEWSGVVNMLSNLEAIVVRQRDFGAAMNFFSFLKLMPNETIWKRPSPKSFNLLWTGIMNWPKLESNGLPSWNIRSWLTQVCLAKAGILNVHVGQTVFQVMWNLCPCRVLGVPEHEFDQLRLGNCLCEKAFRERGQHANIFIRAIKTFV